MHHSTFIQYWLILITICLTIASFILVDSNYSLWLDFGAIIITFLLLYKKRKELNLWMRRYSRPGMMIDSRKKKQTLYQAVAVNTLILLVCILSIQFIAKVYAMSFSLNFTTTETKVSKRTFFADIDGDGDDDALAFNNDGTDTYKSDIYTNVAGSFSHTGTFGSSLNFQDASAGDIDGDGDVDFIIAYQSGLFLRKLMNDGSGLFTGSDVAVSLSTAVLDILLLDIDQDGDLDIVAGGTAHNAAVYINNGAGVFAVANSTLPTFTAMAAGDFDSDGDIDLALTDTTLLTGYFSVYINSGTGAFVAHSSASYGSGNTGIDATVGDLDGDGDLDIVISTDSGLNSPFLNNGLGFYTLGTTFTNGGSPLNDAGFGDIDNDGDIDVVSPGFGAVNDSWLNNGSSVFSLNGSSIEINYANALAITDTDNDGDLDYTVANANGGTGIANRFYTSDQSLTSANTAPTAPSSGFTVEKISDNGSVATLRISWGSGSDTETATRLLQYQLRVGTGSTKNNIVSGKTASPHWVSRLMPNGQSRTYLLKNVICRTGLTYYWGVSTVDTGFNTTASPEQNFTLDSSCAISPTGGGSPSAGSPGGGLSSRYFRTNSSASSLPSLGLGRITVSGFTDYNGNNHRDYREPTGFAGLAITASGRTVDNASVRTTLHLNDQGQALFDLPPSDDRGYWILFDTGATMLKGYASTGEAIQNGFPLISDQKKTVDLGFRKVNLLAYAPCLTIGAPTENEKTGSDARILLQRLENSFGQKIATDVTMHNELFTRRDFLKLLASTHCVPMIRNTKDAGAALRESAKNLAITLPLIDLPLDMRNSDSLLVYSLLIANADITRSTSKGYAADLSSPITRSEVIRIIRSLLPIPHEKNITTHRNLPIDLHSSDPLASDYLALHSLNILPDSFLPVFGKHQGIDSDEAALLIVRSAFRAGRISLISQSDFTQKIGPQRHTFLAMLPASVIGECLETMPHRRANIRFVDIFPGDTLFDDLSALLTRGTKNSAEKILWLITGTRRPTEFGILRGQIKVELSEPVTLIETLRSLLVLSCLPPPTSMDVLSGRAGGTLQGSGKAHAARDFISGLPRNATFFSRMLYRAQDHQTAFDQSLFSYYPQFLRQEIRSPVSGLSVAEATNILASALLMMKVKEGVLTPTSAENLFQELSAAIRKDFLGTDIRWREENSTNKIPFTKGMLLQFLATVTSGRTLESDHPTSSRTSLGEQWWDRIN